MCSRPSSPETKRISSQLFTVERVNYNDQHRAAKQPFVASIVADGDAKVASPREALACLVEERRAGWLSGPSTFPLLPSSRAHHIDDLRDDRQAAAVRSTPRTSQRSEATAPRRQRQVSPTAPSLSLHLLRAARATSHHMADAVALSSSVIGLGSA